MNTEQELRKWFLRATPMERRIMNEIAGGGDPDIPHALRPNIAKGLRLAARHVGSQAFIDYVKKGGA